MSNVDKLARIRQRLMIKRVPRTTAAVSSAMRPEAQRIYEQVWRVPETQRSKQ